MALAKLLLELLGHRLTAVRAVIVPRHIAILAAFQIDFAMHTERGVHLLGPPHLSFICFRFFHVTSSSSLGHLCRQVGFTQAHMRNCGMVILRPESVQVMKGLAFWL